MEWRYTALTYSFPYLEPVSCPMSGSRCCFLTCIWFLRREVGWSSVPISFKNLKTSWFMCCWSLAWRIFEHYFASMWDECNCIVVWTFSGIDLWDWNKNWRFLVLWPLLSFPNLLVYWVQHFHSITFQDLKQLNWNSITSTRLHRLNILEQR